jgi:A/G-specific adenine glycosylase
MPPRAPKPGRPRRRIQPARPGRPGAPPRRAGRSAPRAQPDAPQEYDLPAPALRAALREAVTAWFAGAQRRLPWREGYEPYRVWVAEIMLQQTQVETVRPYFERWMARFPDLTAVAAAPQQAVLKAWEGLGYYSRARNLQRAAQAMVERHGGRVPDDLDALRALPGIGRYTAGAILSIGFDRPAPLVDGNVGRVLGRVVALDVPARSPAGQRRLWALAEALVPGPHPRDFNQGLMELGALVCRPAAPLCLLCPVQAHCRARAVGRPEDFPPPSLRRPRPLRRGALLLLSDARGRLLLRRRPPEGVWGGLWEPPWSERGPGESAVAAARRLLAGLGLRGEPARLVRAGVLSHGLTHFELELTCYRAKVTAPQPDRGPAAAQGERCWADAARIAALPLARLGHKALRLASSGGGCNPGPAAATPGPAAGSRAQARASARRPARRTAAGSANARPARGRPRAKRDT